MEVMNSKELHYNGGGQKRRRTSSREYLNYEQDKRKRSTSSNIYTSDGSVPRDDTTGHIFIPKGDLICERCTSNN